MALIEAVLIYRPGGADSEGEFRIVGSSSPAAVQSVAKAALDEARDSVRKWSRLDTGIAAMRQADVTRLEKILHAVLPPDAGPVTTPPLKLIPRKSPA